MKSSYLDLVDVNLAILLPQLLIRLLHRIYSRHRIPQVVRRENGRLHVECLLLYLGELALVHLLLLQCAQSPLFDGSLHKEL